MNGADQMTQMKQAGFSDDEIGTWRDNTAQQMTAAGFSQDETQQYFGINANPDLSKVSSGLKANIDAHVAANTNADTGEKPALNFEQALEAGWQSSVTGLIANGKAPDKALSGNEPWYTRQASNVVQMMGDAPAMIAGFLGGSAAGTAAGGAVGSAIGPEGTAGGAAVGALVGAGAGTFAAPTFIREALIDQYKNGTFKNFSDFWDRAGPMLLDTAKSAAVGAATAGVGAGAGSLLAKTALPGVAKVAGVTAAEVTTIASMGKALDGQMPTAQDFEDAAVLLGGMKTVGHVAPRVAAAVKAKLQDTFVKTGVTPEQVVKDSDTDPTIMQDLHSDTNDPVPSAYAPDPDGRAEPAFTIKGQPADDLSSAVDAAVADAKGETPTPTEPPGPDTPTPTEPPPPEAGSDEAAQAKILDQISVGGKDAAKPGTTLAQLYTKSVDSLYPIKQAVAAITDGKGVPTAEDPYQLARLTNGAYGKAQQMLENGTFDFNTYETNGPSLKEALDPVKGDLDGLRAFLASRRAVELAGRGLETGFDLDAAKQVLSADDGKFADVAKKLDDFQGAVLKYGKDSGLFTDAAYDAMLEANQAYVPFNRVIEGVNGGPGLGLKVRNPIKEIKGSSLTVVDPLESIIKNTYTMVAMAERNAVAKSFYDLASKSEDADAFFQKVDTPMRPINISDPEMQKFLEANGIDKLPDDALTVFRATRQALAKDEVGFFDDGKWTVLKVDPDLAEAFAGTDVKAHGLLMSLLAFPAKGLRAGSALSPDFITRHYGRIQLTTFAYSENGYVPIYDTIRGLMAQLGRDDDYQNWLKSGGANVSMVTLDRSYVQSEIFHLIDTKPETNFIGQAWNVATKPLEWMRVTQEVLENATRIGEFKRAGNDGTKASIQSAGMDSRDVNIDSARIGSQMRGMNSVTAFFNSEVQHMDQMVNKIADNPIGTLAKIFAAVTVPSILFWLNNHDDERVQQLPAWQRDLFWIVPTQGHIFRIPKPFMLGVLFGSTAERALDAMFPNGNRSTSKNLVDFAKDIGSGATPNVIPTAITPIVEQMTNYSFFEGHALVPDSKEKLLPEFRYGDYTTELTKQMGHLVGTVSGVGATSLASPMVIDNYVTQWGGTLGTYMLKLADAALRKSGALPDPNKPSGTLADVPVVRAFVVRYPSATAQSIQDFREDFAKRAMVFATVQQLAKDGEVSAVQRVIAQNPTMARLTGIETALGKMTTAIHLVDVNPTMAPDAKRQIIDGIYMRMIQMTKSGNQAMQALDAQTSSLAH